MIPALFVPPLMSRRELLHRATVGVGSIGLATLFGGEASGADVTSLAPKKPQFTGKAKRIVHLFMNGGPSQVDTFDPKPMLEKYHGKNLPTPNLKTERRTGAAMPSPYKFQKYGQSGIEVSEIFPHVARHVDDLCVI